MPMAMSNPLAALLNQKEVVIADGAMGTNLFQLGLEDGACAELWNVDHPDRLETVHRSFVSAGSDILLTNTFSANRYRLAMHGLEHRVAELNIAGARVARSVAGSVDRPVIVAGDMGPIGDMLEPVGTRTASEAEEAFFEQAQALKEGGVDIAWIETLFADEELDAAVRALQRAGLAYVATMTFDTGGFTMMGIHPEAAMRRVRRLEWKPIAFGANCGVGPSQLLDSVLGLARGAEDELAVVAKSNCGVPVVAENMEVTYNGTPQAMATYACLARDAGARIIGGCCGTTAGHIRAMVEALEARPRAMPPSCEDIERKLGPFTITGKPAAIGQ